MAPRNRKKNEEIRQESMQNIMDAAFQLIARQGYESTSIAQIATKAGVSKGLMYNYFMSKEDLLEKLIQTAMAHADHTMAPAFAEDPRKTLENLFRLFFKELRERPDFWRLMTELTLKIDKFKFVQQIAAEKWKGYTEILQGLLARIGVENPVEEAMIVAALFDGIGIQSVVIKNNYPLEVLEKILINKYCK